MLLRYNVADPVLVSVNVFTVLLVPSFTLPKPRDFVERLAIAPLLPIPTRKATCCGLL